MFSKHRCTVLVQENLRFTDFSLFFFHLIFFIVQIENFEYFQLSLLIFFSYK